MTDSGPEHTVAGVFHHMYVANGERFHFSETLAELLGMDIANLRALYDLPAPIPARRTSRTGCVPSPPT